MKTESVSDGLSKSRGDLQTPMISTSSRPRLFGRKCSTWDRDEIEEILDYFQVEHWQTKRKTALFDLMCHRVVQDRGVDESAIPATKLLRFIRGDDGATTQPLIGAKPQGNDESESENGGSSGTGKSQNSLKRKHDDMDAPGITNLTDYWPGLPVQDCVVCSTELLRTVNTPWRRITSGCAHRSTICLTCLQQHVENQLAMNAVNTIPCPMCHATLNPADIQAWSNPEFFDRYGRISVQQAMHEALNFRWCAAPDCQNGFLCDPESESYTTCDACGRMTCLNYDIDYHGGISCKDFQDQRTKAEGGVRLKQEQDQQSMAEALDASTRSATSAWFLGHASSPKAIRFIGKAVNITGPYVNEFQAKRDTETRIVQTMMKRSAWQDRIAEDGGFLHDAHQWAVVQRGVAEDDGIGIEVVEANTGADNITIQE